jgi:hypothetical protein
MSTRTQPTRPQNLWLQVHPSKLRNKTQTGMGRDLSGSSKLIIASAGYGRNHPRFMQIHFPDHTGSGGEQRCNIQRSSRRRLDADVKIPSSSHPVTIPSSLSKILNRRAGDRIMAMSSVCLLGGAAQGCLSNSLDVCRSFLMSSHIAEVLRQKCAPVHVQESKRCRTSEHLSF